MGLLIAGLLLIWPLRRRPVGARRRRPARDERSVERVAQSLRVAMSAGVSLRDSLVDARPQLDDFDRRELDRVLRRSQQIGLGSALARSTGVLSPLLVRLAGAQTTGAPPGATLAGFLEERRVARKADRLEQARRLPVKLTVPLALLILPGFVLVTIGPALMATIEQTLRPWLP